VLLSYLLQKMLLHKSLRPYISLLGHSQLRNLKNQHIGETTDREL